MPSAFSIIRSLRQRCATRSARTRRRLRKPRASRIEHISKSHIRKEDIVAKAIAQRGDHPGLAHVISAMEACGAYEPWHDKKTHKTFLRPDSGKCLHYYFYFIDEELGLIYVRVPTWAPFRLQFYCNGHSWLARKLSAEGIGFTAGDNAFLRITDWNRAQELADGFSPGMLHRILDRYAALCCPVLDTFKQSYHWSLMQVEYSTDLVFHSKQTLAPLYEQLARHSVLTVKAETIATFLGRSIAPNLAQEIGSQFSTRIEGTCIKHRFGKSSVKMYDKLGTILRIETTTNDVSSFKHYRKVEHRKGPSSTGFAPMKKNIYSLGDLAGILFACNRRYLAHLSALDDFSAGVRLLDRVTRPRKVEGKTVKGDRFLQSHRTHPAWCITEPQVQYRWCPPRRSRPAAGVPLAFGALAPDPPPALSRSHQTRCQNLPLLPHLRRTSRHRCRLSHH